MGSLHHPQARVRGLAKPTCAVHKHTGCQEAQLDEDAVKTRRITAFAVSQNVNQLSTSPIMLCCRSP